MNQFKNFINSDRILAVGVSRNPKTNTNEFCGIFFEKGNIKEFVTVPADYSMDEFVEVLKSKPWFASYLPVIYDGAGIGIMWTEKNFFNELYLVNINELHNSSYYRKSKTVDFLAKEIINDQALDFEGDRQQKIEFKKLMKEIQNVEITHNVLGVFETKKIKNISDVRYRTFQSFLYFYQEQKDINDPIKREGK